MLRFLLLMVGGFLLVGCAPKEATFLQSMSGRWAENNVVGNQLAVDGKLITISDNGTIAIFTPSGKFDSVNDLLPVKTVIYPAIKTETDVVIEAAKLICPVITEEMASAFNGAPEAMKNEYINEMVTNCFNDFEARNHTLLQKLQDAKGLLHNGVSFDLILFNAAPNSEKATRFGAKKENGSVVSNSSFVRELNADEQKLVTSYSEKLTSRNALIDKTIDKIIVGIKNTTQANANTPASAVQANNGGEGNATPIVSGVEAQPR